MTKSLSASEFSDVFYNSFRLIEAYTERKNLAKVFKMCRLKPSEILFDNCTEKLKVYKIWVDEFRNSISIINKKIVLKYNDLSFKKVISTDMYYNLSIDKIAKISTFAFCIYGKTDENEDCCLITFLGMDKYLRTFLYLDEWAQVSPLLNGIENLLFLSRKIKARQLANFKNRKGAMLPCAAPKAWLTCLPCKEGDARLLSLPYLKGVIIK